MHCNLPFLNLSRHIFHTKCIKSFKRTKDHIHKKVSNAQFNLAGKVGGSQAKSFEPSELLHLIETLITSSGIHSYLLSNNLISECIIVKHKIKLSPLYSSVSLKGHYSLMCKSAFRNIFLEKTSMALAVFLTLFPLGGQSDPQHYIVAYKPQTAYT